MTDETTHIARQAAALDEAQKITMTYRNWRGEVGTRTIQPWGLRFDTTEWHPEPGWLLEAWDFDKGAVRDFALADCQFADLARPSLAGDERVARQLQIASHALQRIAGTSGISRDAKICQEICRAALSAMNTPAQGGEE